MLQKLRNTWLRRSAYGSRSYGYSNNSQGKRFDRSVLYGIAVSAIFILGAILLSGEALRYMSLSGLAIVGGGVLGATLLHHLPEDLMEAKAAFFTILYTRNVDTVTERARYLSRLSQVVKADGMVALDREASNVGEGFLKLALELASDGLPREDIERVLRTEMESAHDREEKAIGVFETLGNYAPAMGLIGTIIGLVQMLGSLGQSEAIGPAMAVALLTTLYGALLANLIFLPFAGKIRRYAEQNFKLKQVTLEGILSLAREENPVVLRQRLRSFNAQVGE